MSGTTMVIVIVALICWTIVSTSGSRKSAKKDGGLSKAEADELVSRLAQLQDRVETLEKIVTDEKYDLHRQFDNLAKDSGQAA